MSLRICLVEPYFGGSHAAWAEGWQKASQHDIILLTLPARSWKWRMHGAAVTLAERFADRSGRFDLIVATDMLDLAQFLGLLRAKAAKVPIALYFHENQLTYPWSPRDRGPSVGNDRHYGYINYSSALAADRVFFNSDYHRKVFLNELRPFLKGFPDHQNCDTLKIIAAKSETLWLGLDLGSLKASHPTSNPAKQRPLIVWNHRWEYDKNPKGFLRLIYRAIAADLDFEVALLGERPSETPPYLREALQRLDRRIAYAEPVSDRAAYARTIWESDIALVTSKQDFFGGSVVEAAYCGCHPILPRRLAFPDHFDPERWPDLFYDTEAGALQRLTALIQSGSWRTPFEGAASLERYDWAHVSRHYDAAMQQLKEDYESNDAAPMSRM